MNSNTLSKDQQPLVSVIIPAYNAEKFIEKTIRSVICQTYERMEVIVVDDCSTDNTALIAKKLAKEDSRIILKKQSHNQGVAAARNTAIKLSQGEYIAPLDSDDLWHPKKIEKQISVFLSSPPSVGLVYTWLVHIDEEDCLGSRVLSTRTRKHIPKGDVYYTLACSNFALNPSCHLIRRACFKVCGDYDSGLRAQQAQGCEDWDLSLRIAKHYKFEVVPEFLVGYREVSTSLSSHWRAMTRSYNLVMQSAYAEHPEIPVSFRKWSKCFFTEYLLVKAMRSGNYTDGLICLTNYIRADYTALLGRRVYIALVIAIVKLTFQPLTSLIWEGHLAWISFKKQLVVPWVQKKRITFSDIDSIVDRYPPRLYRWLKPDQVLKRWIMEYRWDNILSLSKQLNKSHNQ